MRVVFGSGIVLYETDVPLGCVIGGNVAVIDVVLFGSLLGDSVVFG